MKKIIAKTLVFARRHTSFIEKSVGGEYYIFNPKTQTICRLNETGKFIWDVLKKPASIKKIVNEVCRQFEVTRSIGERDARSFIKNLNTAGLVASKEAGRKILSNGTTAS